MKLPPGVNFIFLGGKFAESQIIATVDFCKFLKNLLFWIVGLVSYRTKHRSISDRVHFVDWWEA